MALEQLLTSEALLRLPRWKEPPSENLTNQGNLGKVLLGDFSVFAQLACVFYLQMVAAAATGYPNKMKYIREDQDPDPANRYRRPTVEEGAARGILDRAEP